VRIAPAVSAVAPRPRGPLASAPRTP
jgi:hypothetical protein